MKKCKGFGEDLKEKIKAERVCDDYKVLGNAFVMLLMFERYIGEWKLCEFDSDADG
mgnify:CR=1 FL=1